MECDGSGVDFHRLWRSAVVTLTAVGVFIAKSVLELCLMVRYQREM